MKFENSWNNKKNTKREIFQWTHEIMEFQNLQLNVVLVGVVGEVI